MNVAKNWDGEFVILREGEPPMKLETLVAQLDHANLTIKTLQAELSVTRTAYRILEQSRNYLNMDLDFRMVQANKAVKFAKDLNSELVTFKEKSDRRANIIRDLLRLIAGKAPDTAMIRRGMKIAEEELVTG